VSVAFSLVEELIAQDYYNTSVIKIENFEIRIGIAEKPRNKKGSLGW